MAEARTFSAVIKQGTYDVLSADTNFYAFITESRLYSLFHQLLHKDDVQTFLEHAERLDGEKMLLRLLDVDGNARPFYISVEAGNMKDRLNVNMIDIDYVLEKEKELYTKLKVQGKLLELYEDDVMIYYPDTKQVMLITDYNVTSTQQIITVEELKQRLLDSVGPEKQENASDFITALQNGERYFEIAVGGSIIDGDKKTKFSLIKGAAVYENGEWVVSVAYIHKAKERGAKNEPKIKIDSLTGLLSKSTITNMAIKAIDIEKSKNVSIAIVDIDFFKKVNDTFGHQVGDEVIKKVASILESEIGSHGVVGRIGGDEFFIIFYDVYDLEDARELLRGVKSHVVTSFPPNNENKPVLSLSIGCASYPKDADNYNDLFALADFALYRAKEKGRNRYIIYDREKHGTLEEIKKSDMVENRINGRGDMSYGDILCVIMDKVYSDKEYSLEKLLDDYIDNFDFQRITIYNEDNANVLYMTGEQVLSQEVLEETRTYIFGRFWQERCEEEMVVLNNISHIENKDIATYELMKKQGIISYIRIKFKDKNGANCILCLESVGKLVVWNTNHLHYYRLMARLLSQYDMVL